MSFGETITGLRKAKGITQEQLSEQLGVTRHGPVIIGLN